MLENFDLNFTQGQSAQLRSTLGQAQRALLGNISDALAAMSNAQNAFDQPKTPPQLGSDPVNTLTHYTALN